MVRISRPDQLDARAYLLAALQLGRGSRSLIVDKDLLKAITPRIQPGRRSLEGIDVQMTLELGPEALSPQ